MENIAPIPSKFCTTIKTFKYYGWVCCRNKKVKVAHTRLPSIGLRS